MFRKDAQVSTWPLSLWSDLISQQFGTGKSGIVTIVMFLNCYINTADFQLPPS